MRSLYECEVRVQLSDVNSFRRKLTQLEGRVVQAYAFADHYYRPRQAYWPLGTQSLRIREHHQPAQPCEVLLSAVEVRTSGGLRFKRSRFIEGKVRLYAGTISACKGIVDRLGFTPWVTVRKREGAIYEVPHLGTLAVEDVAEVGWMSELETDGTDPDRAGRVLRAQLEALGLDPQLITPDPVVVLIETRGAKAARKVYFSGSIRGGRSLQPVYAQLVAFLEQRGCEVLTAHVADQRVLELESRSGGQASDIYRRDLRWLEACDVVIAEVSTPSLGVGVELAIAQHLNKPVICLCRQDVTLSAMVGGNEALHHIRYQHVPELLQRLEKALATL